MHLKRDIIGWLVTGLHSWETRNHLTSSAWNTYKTGRIGTKVSGRDSEEKKKGRKPVCPSTVRAMDSKPGHLKLQRMNGEKTAGHNCNQFQRKKS